MDYGLARPLVARERARDHGRLAYPCESRLVYEFRTVFEFALHARDVLAYKKAGDDRRQSWDSALLHRERLVRRVLADRREPMALGAPRYAV